MSFHLDVVEEKEAKKLVARFLRDQYETSAAGYLADNHGLRMKLTGDVLNIATTYFYESQNQTCWRARELDDWLFQYGLGLWVTDRQGQPYNTRDWFDCLSYDQQPWPKTSWANLYFKVIHVR